MILKFRAILARGFVPILAEALVDLRDALLAGGRCVVRMVSQGLHLRGRFGGFCGLQKRLLVPGKIQSLRLSLCGVREPVDLERAFDRLARHAQLAGGFGFAAGFAMPSTILPLAFILPNLGSLIITALNNPDPLRYQPRAFDLADLPAVQVLRDFRQAAIRLAAVVTVDRWHL